MKELQLINRAVKLTLLSVNVTDMLPNSSLLVSVDKVGENKLLDEIDNLGLTSEIADNQSRTDYIMTITNGSADVKPEVRQEVKQEVKPEVKPEVKQESIGKKVKKPLPITAKNGNKKQTKQTKKPKKAKKSGKK